MALAAFNFAQWIDRHAHLLKPPVGNMVLRAIEDGRPRELPIREGEVLLLRDMQGLGEGARAKLIAGNARRFFGLP